MTTDADMSMLEIHSRALEQVDTAFHYFLLYYKKNDQCVYGFVEGKDDPSFYRYLIEDVLPEGWSVRLFPSGNREKVLLSYRNFDWSNYHKTRICFFVDRDLHDFFNSEQINESNVYVTDGYSIENSVLGMSLLLGVLSDVYQISPLPPDDEEKIKQVFRESETVFYETMIPLMAQILLWRRSKAKANLSNLDLKSFFSFPHARCTQPVRKTFLEGAAKQIGCDLSSEAHISAAEAEFLSISNPNTMVRGKYVLWFFVKQCEAIWESITKLLPSFQHKPNKRTECGIHNAMLILGPRARIPQSLKRFIEQNYLSFIYETSNS